MLTGPPCRGQFCLTELGHGLDVFNMKTTATLLDTGEFDLHTPDESAAKCVLRRDGHMHGLTNIVRYMPPTTPVDKPCVAIVFARVMVDGADHGIKPFMVHLHDGKHTMPGVTTT
jgi:acyl-CoA oxidase